MSITPIPELVAELAAGRMVILVDEEDRENEGDLILAADCVTPEAINFMARFARGLICLTLTRERCERLQLPPMTAKNGAQHGTAFTVSIEAATGVTTGISAADRARTVQAAVRKDAKASDLVQPGHIFPLLAQDGGVLVRTGKMWPGWTRSAGLASRATATWMVRARSAAEMPVVTPVAASIETVNAVPCWAPFFAVIGGSCSRSQRSRGSVRQIRPRPKRAMKLMASGVTWSAASTRSPSFSRSSSSTRMTIRPAASSATSSGIGAIDMMVEIVGGGAGACAGTVRKRAPRAFARHSARSCRPRG